MTFKAVVINVLIASPGDTLDARDAVEAVVKSWNTDRARNAKVVLLPLRWETDSVPVMGAGDGQAVINKQLVDDADIVVGLFHARLGSPTGRAPSGTAEEIERSIESESRVHVYFSEMPISRNFDRDQLEALDHFKADIQDRGLLGSYASLDDLRAKVRTALERDVHELVGVDESETRSEAPGPRAVLRASYRFEREPHTDSKGRVSMRSRRQRLEIENIGDGPADAVSISVEPEGDGHCPYQREDGEPEARVLPNSSIQFPVYPTFGVAPQWRVTMRWKEDGKEYEEVQSVRI